MTPKGPIKILGAGPSGLAAAIHLARNGQAVEVFERNDEVGMRFKGDLQGLENWSDAGEVKTFLTHLGISINFNFDPFSKLSISNGSKMWEFNTKKPAFYLVKRGPREGSLDRGLKEQALNAGAIIHFGKTLDSSEADILATGPNSREVFAVDTGIVFKTNMKDMTVGIVHDDAGYKGYAYLLVSNGYGCMCAYNGDKFKRVNACFKEAKRLFGELVELDIQEPAKVGGIGSFTLQNEFVQGQCKQVGEAAGLQDLLWGFGIRSALLSGHLAARSILEGKDYADLARRTFQKKLKASLVSRYFWEKFGTGDYAGIVDRIHGAVDPLKYLHSFHNFNLLQRIFYPIALRYCRKKYTKLRL